MLVVCSSICLAYDPDITEMANIIDRSTDNTLVKAAIVDYYVENVIKYEFNWFPKGIDRTWKDKKGDCTDKSMLKQFMYYKMGINSRLVHGYDPKGKKHDWLQFRYKNDWLSLENDNTYVGASHW